MSTPDTVTAEMELRLVVAGGPALPVMADLSYDPSDPYAVRVAFHTGASDVVEWTFARQLLTDGIDVAVGEGDVQVWPSQRDGARIVSLSLSSPSGRALFEVPLPQLVQFLTSTFTLVPTGSEGDFVDVDAELALLMWGSAES